jgi:hypothetical protein
MPPMLIWGVFVRLLGLVYLVAFASLSREVLAWAGSRGVTPVREVLARAAADYPGARRFAWFPTLLWIDARDATLRGLLLAGVGAALAVVFGGPWSPAALAVCWAVYLSFDVAFELQYPWECVLLEAGALAVFLPALRSLPALAATSEAFPVVAWAYRLLLFRIVLGFGKFKFRLGERMDWDYLRGFLIAQPLVNRLGWYAAHAPRWMLRAGVAFLFLVEIPIPFLVFVGPARLVAAGAITALMAGIFAFGSFGFFNLVVIVLCVPLLDARASLFDAHLGSAAEIAATVYVACVAASSLVHFPFSTWVARGWPFWPALAGRMPGALRAVVAAQRALGPFRLVHAYGVFPPRGFPAARWIPVVEGSLDGETWLPYRCRYLSSGAATAPGHAAPHTPRLDHWLLYEALGVGSSGLLGTVFGGGIPYRYTRPSPLERLVQRLLEGSAPVERLFARVPFERPPAWVRVRMVLLEPATLAERARTGAWWHETGAAPHLAPRRLDPDVWRDWLPGPEEFHPDEIFWRRRAPSLRGLLDGSSRPEAGLDAGDVDRFFAELVPALPRDALDPDALARAVTALRARFAPTELRRLERVARRLSLALAARLEPRFLGSAEPRLEAPSWFHVCLAADHVVAEGRAAYEAALADPASVAAADPSSGLRLLGVFRYETLMFQAMKARHGATLSDDPPRPLTPFLPGFAQVLPLLAERLRPADEPPVPRFVRDGDGGFRRIDPPTEALSPARSAGGSR